MDTNLEKSGNEEIESVHTLTYTSIINVDEILTNWVEEWNETLDNCTEEWKLIAFPVLADGTVALMFENTHYAYYLDENEESYKEPIENCYRVLIYDPISGNKKSQYRFRVAYGYASTVFFKEGALYAVTSEMEETSYMAVEMWPCLAEANRFYMGEDINCIVATSDGEVIVSYEKCGNKNDPAVSIFDCKGNVKGIQCSDEFEVIDLNLDTEERIWMLLDDYETIIVDDGEGAKIHTLPTDFLVKALGLTDNPNNLFVAAVGQRMVTNSSNSDGEKKYTWEDCCMLNKVQLLERNLVKGHITCTLQTENGMVEVFDSVSFLLNWAVIQIGGKLYCVDLNG